MPLPQNFPTQHWFNRQSYEVLAEITEMLWKTHTIKIPEWDKMTEEDVNERCTEWGVERGKNVFHSRWRLRAANDDKSDEESDDTYYSEEESEEEDAVSLESETGDEEEEMDESYLASKRKRDAEIGRQLLNQALAPSEENSDGPPPLELLPSCYDPDGWAFGKGKVGGDREQWWWNDLENKFANDEGSLTQDELMDLMWKRGLADDDEQAQRHPNDMIIDIKRYNTNWIRHKERGGGPIFPGNPQSSYSAWEDEYLGD